MSSPLLEPAKHSSPLLATAQRLRLPARNGDDEPYSVPPTDAELRSICRGMRDALAEEHAAACADVIHLQVGERAHMAGSGYVYRFQTTAPSDAASGDPALLRLGGREYEAVVAAVEDRHLELTLSEDLGARLQRGAELLLEAPWLVSRLRKAVDEAFAVGLTTPHVFNLRTALLTLGVGEIEVAAAGLTPEYENEQHRLGTAQVRAVEVAFRSPLSLIAAPAGTGKTLTLAALAEACWRAGLRTLVTAASNNAVDLLMTQVCERLSSEPGFAEAQVLRVGSDAGDELRHTYGPQVVLEDVVARLRPRLLQDVQKAQASVDALAAELARRQAESPPCSGEVIADLRCRLATARKRLYETHRQMRDYARRLTSSAGVVGCTLARAFLDPQLNGFDVVIIDEGSQASAPACFHAAGLARKHVVIAGDPFQLAAPVRSHGVNRGWLEGDVFHRLDVVRAIQDDEGVEYLTVLDEQRRCAEPICEMQRELWYGPRLRTAPQVRARERARPNHIFAGQALCYVDTSRLNASAYHPWGRTWANDRHASLLRDVVAYLDSAGELPADAVANPEVLLMSYYRGQVWNIRKLLGPEYLRRGVHVRTVHKSQGAEAMTAVLDLTLTSAQRTRESGILTAVSPRDDGSRVLAVAASRARSRFILVGDMRWLERSVAPESVLGRLYAHLLEHGYEIPVEELRGSTGRARLHVVR